MGEVDQIKHQLFGRYKSEVVLAKSLYGLAPNKLYG